MFSAHRCCWCPASTVDSVYHIHDNIIDVINCHYYYAPPKWCYNPSVCLFSIHPSLCLCVCPSVHLCCMPLGSKLCVLGKMVTLSKSMLTVKPSNQWNGTYSVANGWHLFYLLSLLLYYAPFNKSYLIAITARNYHRVLYRLLAL